MLSDTFLTRLIAELDSADVQSIGLTGSYARGTATSYSDVDVYCFSQRPLADQPGYTLRLIDGHLVSITCTTVEAKRSDLHAPDSAIWAVPGLRQMRILLDKTGQLAALKREADDWRWTADLQAQADAYASRELMGYAEEVHKVLSGLLKVDDSTALYGTYGLTLGLSRIVLVQGGALLETENAYFQQAQEAAGLDSAWTKHFRTAVGFDTLPEGVDAVRMRSLASLRLYGETAQFLHAIIKPEHREVIERTLSLIDEIKVGEHTASPYLKD